MFPILSRNSICTKASPLDGSLLSWGWVSKSAIIRCCWISSLMLVVVVSSSAQEALQNMEAGNTAADSRAQQMQSTQPQDYTFKKGDFQLLLAPSLELEYIDNINLAKTNVLDDYLVIPQLGITVSYPLSRQNLLYLDFTVGYDWYLKNSQFSSFNLNASSGTGLSFDFVVKDFTINLHDWVSYVQGAGQNTSSGGTVNSYAANSANATVANTATYGTFQNTAGISGLWNLNQVTLSAGYDHQNVLSTSGQFNEDNHTSELFFVRAGFQVHPKASIGLESTAGLTTYDQDVLNDNKAYTVGPYIQFRPDKFLQITARGGYSIYDFQNTSATIQTASQNSWYADLNISHQPTKSVNYSLDAGRDAQLGTVSDLVEDWYVRPKVTFKIVKGLDINAFLFYEHGNQGVGSSGIVSGSSNETFDWYGGGFTLQHALTSWLIAGLTYTLTLRSSSTPNDGYTQNLVGLQLTYHPR